MRIFRTPGVSALIFVSTLARLPLGLFQVGILLFVAAARHGAYDQAGLVVGAGALGAAIGLPVSSRLVDRVNVRMLAWMAVVQALAALGLLAAGRVGASTATMALLAALCVGSTPPVGSVLRSRWSELLRTEPSLVPAAFGLTSSLTEMCFLCGPVIGAVLYGSLGTAAPLIAAAVFVVLGTVSFVVLIGPSPDRPEASSERSWIGPVRSAGIRWLLAADLSVGFSIGCIEVAMAAFCHKQGRPGIYGAMLALWAAGSLVGGLLFAPTQGDLRQMGKRHLHIAAVLALATVPMSFVGSIAAMIPLITAAGLPMAPYTASRDLLATILAPAGETVEAVTLPLAASLVGGAAGAPAAGLLLASEGFHEGFALAAVAISAAALLIFLGRGRLRCHAV